MYAMPQGEAIDKVRGLEGGSGQVKRHVMGTSPASKV